MFSKFWKAGRNLLSNQRLITEIFIFWVKTQNVGSVLFIHKPKEAGKLKWNKD